MPEVPEKFEIPHPPYDAATCVDLLLRHDWLSYNKFPVTIRKRLETASAVSTGKPSAQSPCIVMPCYNTVLV